MASSQRDGDESPALKLADQSADAEPPGAILGGHSQAAHETVASLLGDNPKGLSTSARQVSALWDAL